MKSKNSAGRTPGILAFAAITLVACVAWGWYHGSAWMPFKRKPFLSENVRSTNPFLWAPPEAFDLKTWREGKRDSKFHYRVRDRYPAKKTIEGINAHLRAAGWTALNEDPFEPGTPGSRNRRWVQTNEPQGPDGLVRRGWMGDWQNKHGDFVRYTLQYETEVVKPEALSEVVVFVQYFNAEQFKSMVDDAAKLPAEDAAKKAPPPR